MIFISRMHILNNEEVFDAINKIRMLKPQKGLKKLQEAISDVLGSMIFFAYKNEKVIKMPE